MPSSQFPGSHKRTQKESHDPNSNNHLTARDYIVNKQHGLELERRCKDHIKSIRLSTEENLPGVESFKGVDWLKEESPWPPDIQHRVYRYMHRTNLYQVTNTNDPAFVNLVNLVKSQVVVPNTRNWQQKVPEKCRALINTSTETWKQDGLLVTRNNLTRKSEVFQYLWDCAIKAARVSYSVAQSIERPFPRGELGKNTSSIDVDSMARTGLTPEDSCSRKRSAESMQRSRPSSHAKRACREQSDIPKDHERELMDIDRDFPSGASPARDVADENTRHTIVVSTAATSHGLHHRDSSIGERSVNRFESTVLTAREALSALDPVEKGRQSLQEGLQVSQEKTHRDFATKPHGDPAPTSCSNHENYQIKVTSWSPSHSNPTSSGRPTAIVEGFNQATSPTPITCPNVDQSNGYSMEKLPSIRQTTSWAVIDRCLSPIDQDRPMISSSTPHEMENSLRNSNDISQNVNLSPDNAPKTSQTEKRGNSLTTQIPAQVSQTLSLQNHQPPSTDSVQSNPANQSGDLDATSEKRYSSTSSENSGFSKCLDEVMGPPQVVTKHQNSSQNSGNSQLIFDTWSSQSINTTELIAQQYLPSGITDKDRDIESTRLVPSRPPILPFAHQANGNSPGPLAISNTQSLLPDNNQIRHVPYDHFPQGPPAAPPHPHQKPATPLTTKEQQIPPDPPPPYPRNRPPPSYFNQEPASLPLSSQYQSQPSPSPPPLASSQNRGPPGSLPPPISTQNQRPSAPGLSPPLPVFPPQYQSPPPRTRCQAPLPPPSTQDLGHPSLQPNSTKQQGLPPPASAQDLVHSSIRPPSTQQHNPPPPPPPAQYHDPPPSPARGQGLPSSSAPTQYQSPYSMGSPTAAPWPLPPQPSLNAVQGPSPPAQSHLQSSPSPPSYQGPPGLPPTQSTHYQSPSLPPPPPNSSTQWQGPQRLHQHSQHVPSLDQQQSSPFPWNSSQHVGNPPPPRPLVTLNQLVGAPSDPSRLLSRTAFPNFGLPAGDLVWKKLNEMVKIIVPVRVQTNADMINSGPMQQGVFPAGSVLTKTVADFFQWVSGILSTTPPPTLFLDFINIHSQFERRMILYRDDPRCLESVKTIAWGYFREIASLDPAVANVKILITPCYSAVSGSVSENIHQQSQQLHHANTVLNIPSDQPSYVPLPNRNDSSTAPDFADRQAICKPGGPPPIGPPSEPQSSLSRTSASETMVSHIGPSNPAPHSMLNLNGINMSERNTPESYDKLVEACATSNQDLQWQSQQQASRLHTPNSTKIDSSNLSTAKIVIRIQIDGLGRLSRSYDKSVLNTKITNKRFFQWFEQETGGTRSSKLKFDFKDAFPAKSSIIERGKEDYFHLMVHDIKRKFNRAKAYVPDMNEFCIVVTDPMWDSGDEDEDEDE